MSKAGASAGSGDGKPDWRSSAAWRRLADVCRGHSSLDRLHAWLLRQAAIEAAARSGFFLLPAGLMLGIMLFYAVGWRPPPLPMAAACLPLMLAAFLLAGRGMAGALSLVAASVAAGMALSGLELATTRTVILSGEATVRIASRVEGREQDERGRLRYRVEIDRTERPVLSRPPGIAEILVSSRHEPIPIGGRYAGLVRLRAPSGPAFPGAYDFGFGNYFDGVGANGFALGPPEAPGPGDADAPQTIGERLLALRLSMSERIRTVVGGPAGAVASALITGDRAGIPGEVDLWLRTTGLSHVLSISGLHMALVAGFAMFVVRAGLAAIPGLALRWPIKKLAAVAALAVVTFYILLSGRNVAADRSYIMLSIMLAAILFDRGAITLRNVALAAIVVLALAPHALVTASFQMSFGATASLVGVYGHYARTRAKRLASAPDPGRAMKLVVFLVGLGASSLIAGTATGPFASYHFQRLAPFGLFANLLALPLFSLWIMPLALIAVVAMPLGLDAPLLQLMGYGLSLVFAIAHFLHDHLPDTPTGLLTASGLVLLSVALMLACFLASGLRWLALPVAAIGLFLAPDRSARPELLVFEDGRELAVIDEDANLVTMRPRPNGFVLTQWQRAFPGGGNSGANRSDGQRVPAPGGFRCEKLLPASPDASAAHSLPSTGDLPGAMLPAAEGTMASDGTAADRSTSVIGSAAPASAEGLAEQAGVGSPAAPGNRNKPAARAPRPLQTCRATTRSGLEVVWTDDYRQVGEACETADIAIVARAIKLETCRSGAVLITLRTLRRTGSLAVSRSATTGAAVVTASIDVDPEPWQVHRLAPWPEAWRRPVEGLPKKPTP